MGVDLELETQSCIAFNGGPHFTFTPAISLFVNCEARKGVEELWTKLSGGGGLLECGWPNDKFGEQFITGTETACIPREKLFFTRGSFSKQRRGGDNHAIGYSANTHFE